MKERFIRQLLLSLLLLVSCSLIESFRVSSRHNSRDANPTRPVTVRGQCCNVAGITHPSTACTGQACVCKVNVQGGKCDECRPGHYNLNIENPDGCSECYCFGATNVCRPSNYSTTTVRRMEGWLVTDLDGRKVVEPTLAEEGHLVVANDELPGIDNYYWDGPQEYLGQKLYSYGGDLKFVLSYVVARGDTSGWFTEDADVILQGGPKNIRIGYNWKRPTREEEGKTVITLPLREQEWFIVDGSGKREPVSREDFTLVTYNLKRMLIRAKFHTDQIEGGLHTVEMDLANATSTSLKIAKGTEQCDCPEGYGGLSCELCAPGYRRVNNTLVNGKCEKCDCNNHSPSCDPYTGKCTVCLHHTTGEKCERCEYGYYGDPTKGTPDDCKRCACPLLEPSNNFSPSCYASESALGGYICDQCPKGYTGDHCERCAEGYFGDPTVLGQFCQPCDCGPGTNTSIPGWCDHKTGQCLRCKGTIDKQCKKCPPRQVLTDIGCVPCDDPCVDMILDDIDAFGIAANEANLTGIKDLPKIRLRWMQSRINKTAYELMEYQHLIANGQRVLQNVTLNFDLEALADILYLKAKDLETRGYTVNNNAVQVGVDAEELLDIIHALLDELNRVIDALRRYGLDGGGGHVMTDRILLEGERILRELKGRNFLPNMDGTERELRKAKHLLERVKKLVEYPGTSHGVQERLDRLRRLLSDFINIVQEKIQAPTSQALALVSESRGLYDFVVSSVENSTKLAASANGSLAEARRLLEIAKSALIESAVQFGLVPRIRDELDNATHEVEIRRSILARLNPKYTDMYVKPCVSHVEELKRRLEHLVGLFNATREVSAYPMQAATVYQKIVMALTAAETAAKRALDAGERAYHEAYPGTDDALVKKAADAKALSYRLLEEARVLRNKQVPELERDLAKKRFALESLREEISNGDRNLQLINRALDQLPQGLSRTLKESDTFLRQMLEGLSDTHSRIDFIDQKMRQELMPKLDRLNEGSASGLENLTRIIERARQDIRGASRHASNSESIVERINKLHKQTSLNLKELKDRILLARQKASSIKVSLGVDYPRQECVRSFKPDIQPSTSNTISLNYAIKDDARDALLFFISSASTDDFMAVEMVDRKIRFLWNAGGGTQVLTHGLNIETNDPHLNKDNQWYKIMVTRIGNVATLKVKRTPEADEADELQVTGSSPPNFSRMDLDSDAYVFIGGLAGEFRAPRELRTRRFAGCLYEVILDGKRIGLWNFKTNYGCRGCKEGATEPRDPSTFQFKGRGGLLDGSYAILPQIKRYDKKKYLIVFQFKTFDEDALLFFSGNAITGDLVSLFLKGGKVVYQFNVGSTSKLILQSRLKYNTGQWVRVAAERDKLEGILSVDDELLEGRLSNQGPVTIELAESQLFFGGIAPNFSVQSWPSVTFSPFLGCMKDLQIDTTPLSLMAADTYGVDNGCKEKEGQVVTFLAPGAYLELKSFPLREEADITFSFSTNQSDALLLLSTFQGQTKGPVRDAHYYSLAVIGGLLEARFNGGAGETPVISDLKVNDGQFHTLSITKRHRRLTMTLDDTDIGTTRMPKGTREIDAPGDGGLYLGGLPPSLSLRGMAGTRESLANGTIRDFVVNRTPIKMTPLNFEKVSIHV